MSVLRSRSSFQILTSPPNLIVHSQLGEELSLFCTLEMCLHNNQRILCETFRCLGEIVLCQLPFTNLCSFLLTCAWCPCQKLLNTFVSIVAFSAFCWLLSCRTSRRRLDMHFQQSWFCFVSGSLLAR